MEAKNSQGETSLFLAANAGESQLLKLLLEDFDANVDTSNFVGETPLYVASLSGHAASVKVLIDHVSVNPWWVRFYSFLKTLNYVWNFLLVFMFVKFLRCRELILKPQLQGGSHLSWLQHRRGRSR